MPAKTKKIAAKVDETAAVESSIGNMRYGTKKMASKLKKGKKKK
jgi:hypothetical protein